MSEVDDMIDLGPCCACGKHDQTVRNIICHSFEKHPDDDKPSWGCLQCGIEAKGASSVICDECLEKGSEIKQIIFGWPKQKQRAKITAEMRLKSFDHNYSKHPEITLH